MAQDIQSVGATDTGFVNVRCPACRQNGTFQGVSGVRDAQFVVSLQGAHGGKIAVNKLYGLRICPNPGCREPIFIEVLSGKLQRSYPPERIDFDPSGIPEKILSTFEEALTNYANGCCRSAAIMVRRTLEEICADKNATGKDLKDRIAALRNVIIVPQVLLDAADELRLLGNDAAHLEAKVYDDIGASEVGAAIDLCKEILKAVYQLTGLVERLRSLKKNP